jgi:formate-dependent nitrite reductase membrane component NrfD
MNDALIEVARTRHNEMIDPSLHVWGWEIPVYLFLGGLVAGLLVLSALMELIQGEKPRSLAIRLAPLAGIVLLSLGMLALFLDLEYKMHVYRFYLAFKPASPMSWGSWILIVVYPVAFLLGAGSLTDRQRESLQAWGPLSLPGLTPLFRWVLRLADEYRRLLLWISVLVGVGLGIYTGILLGTMVARPQWNTPILGPLFLVSGISTGAAFLTLFRLDEHEQHTLVRWDMIAICVELILIALMIIGFATGGEAAQHAFYHIMGGPWTAPFWALVVFTGLLVPLVMEWVEMRRQLAFTPLTPVLILIGGLALRFVLLSAGQASSFREFM